MTKAEIIDLVRAKIQNKGAVSGTVVFDLSLYTFFTAAISADIAITLNNPQTPSSIYIDLTHTVAGKVITNLPGVITWDFSWATNAGDRTILVGVYNGTSWSWSSTIYQSIPTLSAPGSFAATNGDTQSVLTWAAVTNATNYLVDRATDAGFTTGYTTGIYSGSLLTFTDTGRTNGVTYYYRIKAQAAGFADSSYSTTNATPAGAVDLIFGTIENTTHTGTEWICPSGGNAFGYNTGKKIAAGTAGFVFAKYASALNRSAAFGLHTSDAHTPYSSIAFGAIPYSGSYQYTPGLNNLSIGAGINDLFGIRRAIGGTVTYERSTDNGVSWTVIYTFAGTSTADLYPVYNVVDSLDKLTDPKGLGLV